MVDLEGLFQSVDRLGGITDVTAGIVGEHVDARVTGVQIGGELANIVQTGEVGVVVVRADLTGDRLGLLRGAADDDDAVTFPMESAGGCRAQPVAGTGDDDDLGHTHMDYSPLSIIQSPIPSFSNLEYISCQGNRPLG